MISSLLGIQLGYTRHACFLCLWDSRDDSNHYTKTICGLNYKSLQMVDIT